MKTILFIFKYIYYFLTSKNEHYIHGPFIFRFVTQIIYGKTPDDYCYNIEELRKNLCQSETIIHINDFGAGSNINKSIKRKIKDIAKNSAKNQKFGELLYRIVKTYKPKKSVELGTSLGVSTCYLAKANPEGRIFTFEGCEETADIAKKNFKKLNLKNIKIILGNFNSTLEKELKRLKTIDLAFIDGNHQEYATISYFEECLNHSHNNTLLVFDDIHWSKGMENAWKYIKKHPKTTVTIDLFFIGIVFLRRELSKEHFTIRF